MTDLQFVSTQDKAAKGQSKATAFFWDGSQMSLYKDASGKQISWAEVHDRVSADMKAAGFQFTSVSGMTKLVPMYLFQMQQTILNLMAENEKLKTEPASGKGKGK